MISPPYIAPIRTEDADVAVAQVGRIYESAARCLREAALLFVNGEETNERVRARYPYVRLRADTAARADSRHSYGFVAGTGVYETTLTRPDLFGTYYQEQLRLLLVNHRAPLEVGTSNQPIALHFAFEDDEHIEATM